MKAAGTAFCLGFIFTAFLARDAAGQSSMQNRLLTPDLDRQQPIELRSANLSKAVELEEYKGGKRFETSEASFGKSFETPKFLGIPIPWLKKNTVETNPFAKSAETFAVTRRGEEKSATIDRTTPINADRVAIDTSRPAVVSPAYVRGTAQGYHDSMQKKAQRELSSEEVRELLNKNK